MERWTEENTEKPLTAPPVEPSKPMPEPVPPANPEPTLSQSGAPAGPAGVDPAKVQGLVAQACLNPELRDALARVLAWEDAAAADSAHPWRKDLGWKAGEIPIPGPAMRALKEAALVRVAYSSNKHTDYLLTDREATRAGLTQGPPLAARVEVPKDRLDEFAEIAASGNALERLAPLVAPHVHDLLHVKRAVLLQLTSADDEGVSRGRIHVFLYGPPGTAKSEILLWAANLAGAEVYSPRMTGPGLTVDLRTCEPGALPRAHGTEFALVCADEVEKLESRVVRQALQALEEGRFTYAAAGATGTMEAEVRFMGAANEIDGLPPEFMDRMDFCIHVPLPTRDAARNIVRSITDGFMRPGAERQTVYLRDYLRWVRAYRPDFPDAERDTVGRLLAMFVDLNDADKVRIRPFEAILRVGYAIARLNRSPVTARHVLQAVQILHPDLLPGKVGALRQVVDSAERTRTP